MSGAVREFTWNVKRGVLHYRNGDQVERIGIGYAGHPPYVNDPEAERLVARGPIPRGAYRIGRPFNHVRLGPVCMFLEPVGDTDMFGRSGFFIHGDNAYGNQSGSHGCIVLPRKGRDRIAALILEGGKTLPTLHVM